VDHTVFIDEDGGRRRHVLTVFARSRVQYLDCINELSVGICHDDQVRKVVLRLLRVIQTIDGNGDHAGVSLGELVVMRFELT
jgi:hypothetical protein